MKRINDTLLAIERADDAAKARAEGRPVCIECGWSCDDLGLEICCDCHDAAEMRAMLRGDYGAEEQADARQSRMIGAANEGSVTR